MKKVSLILVAMICSTVAFSQFRGNSNYVPRNTNSPDAQKKFYFGGGGGLSFGTGFSFYSISPLLGYRVTDRFSTGTWFTYQRLHSSLTNPPYTYQQYGVMPFLRYNFDALFFQTEFDFISSPVQYYTASDVQRQIYNRWLFGLGYSSPMGRGQSAVNVLAMYDILYKQGTSFPFPSPFVFRVFVTF